MTIPTSWLIGVHVSRGPSPILVEVNNTHNEQTARTAAFMIAHAGNLWDEDYYYSLGDPETREENINKNTFILESEVEIMIPKGFDHY